jgi:protein-tyrosine phosphatase/nicotinamidase-related amidase/aminoglycoside phosphotransferase (APT) family kinase protein
VALSILITQCLQRDFVDLVHPHDPLPNRLHVGHSEALRLLGPEPSMGPVAQLMSWAREQPKDAVEILHIRDWHAADDPRQREHLAMFGEHCIRGTRGASLILDLDQEIDGHKNEHVVDSITLSDFEGTNLQEHLRRAILTHGARELRIGVVGVWTDAKVSFLLYDLKTRLGIDALATCSALTASSSRAQHFNALEQLGRILGVSCFESVGEFISWLNPGAAPRLPATARFGPQTTVVENGRELAEPDRDIVGYLYRDSSRVVLEPLSGGFSGALVFRAASQDSLGHRQAPSVVKLGPTPAIARERVAFERVEEILGNNAPRVRGFVDLGDRAGIKYSYAAMGQGKVRTFKSMLEAGCPQEKVDAILREVFGEILGPLYAASRYERLSVLEHYGFSPKWAPSVRGHVAALVGEAAALAPTLAFPGGYSAMNVCRFYEEFLAREPLQSGEFHYVSYVHGDLNAANILIDGRDNVWVIDYFHTAPGHVLQDLAKLENDLLYILTPLASESDLEGALRISRALRAVEDLRAPLPALGGPLPSEALEGAWRTLATLRSIGSTLCREDRHPLQLDVALLRYAVHTLGFDESSPLQKRWALATACGLAEDIQSTVRADRMLRIDWVDPAAVGGGGRLGMTICPGRRDRGRDLTADLEVLSAQGTKRLVCLLTDEELEWAGAKDIAAGAKTRGIEFRLVPVRDQSAPGLEDARALVAWILAAVDAGDTVVLHCMGGLGRTGTVAACALTSRGLSAEQAIATVRKSRGPRCVETREQERFVAAFAQEGARP